MIDVLRFIAFGMLIVGSILFVPYVLGYMLGAVIGTAKKISNQIYKPEKNGNYNVIFHDKKGEAHDEKRKL